MGTWGSEPWANDGAGDWFDDLMTATSLRDQWLKGIESNPAKDADVVRAAAWLFIQLGLVYVWPIDHYQDDIERTIDALRAVQTTDEFAEDEEIVEAIESEIRELQSRALSAR